MLFSIMQRMLHVDSKSDQVACNLPLYLLRMLQAATIYNNDNAERFCNPVTLFAGMHKHALVA